MRLRTLGSVRLEGVDGERLRGRRKELALLAYLARRAPRATGREELATLLWGTRPDANARQSLRQALSHLKQAVGAALTVDGERVALAPEAIRCDAAEFERACAEQRLRDAVELYQGEFMHGLEDAGDETFRAWVESERALLRSRAATAFERLVRDRTSDGALDDAQALAQRWAELSPADERPVAVLHEVLTRLGRVDEARARVTAFAVRARAEAGIEPSPAFLTLASASVSPPPAARAPNPGVRALFTPDLAGRHEELAALRAAWESAAGGYASLVLIEGAEGLGKTRLCEEFLRGLPGGTVVFRARGLEARRSTPFGLVRELLADLGTAPGVAGARPAALGRAGDILPVLRERFPARPSHEPHEDIEQAIGEVLAAVASEAPVLLFVDDVPLADRESRDIILSLARRYRRVPLCIVLTATSGEAPAGLLAELRGRSDAVHMHLNPLGAGALKTLVGSMLVMAPQDLATLLTRLEAEAQGNPLAVVETVAWLAEEGFAAADDRGIWRLRRELPAQLLPLNRALLHSVRRRFASLSDAATRLAAAMAILGAPAPPETLAGVSHLTDDALHGALEELLLARLIRTAPERQYGFAHEVGRRAMLETLSGAERRRLEHRVAALTGRGRWRRRLAVGTGIGVITVGTILGLRALGPSGGAAPVYAVGRIQDYSGDQVATAVADMLTTSLTRVPDLSVVSTARMYELTGGDTTRILAAARRAGVTVLMNGAVFRAPSGSYRLELQQTTVEDGRVLSAARMEGTNLLALVDSATAAIARSRGTRPPATTLAAQTTTSLAAYRLYSEGLRAYQLHNTEAARALLDAAVAEDSTFAMAWLWAARAHREPYAEWRRRMDHAVHLAPRAPERERLLILADFANRHDAPERLALAETLATRFPDDAEAQLQLGVALLWDGQFLEAAGAFRRTLALDRSGLAATRAGERCLACEAVGELANALRLADSMEANIRAVQPWTREAPQSADAWYTLAHALMYARHPVEARAAVDTAARFSAPETVAFHRALIALHAGEDWQAGERFFASEVERAERDAQTQGLWWLIIIRRNQGRLNEALALARRFRQLTGDPLPEAQVRFELGDHASAARLFRAIASAPPTDEPRTRQARQIAWYLTHTATALAAGGDTASLLALADSVEVVGRQTAYGRDRRLHHHIRGLLFAARGRRDEAIESFQRAVFSPTAGYTRSSYELGRLLLAAGRPREAAAALRPALYGGLEASNYYITRTEIHALLGRTFEAAGQADSALAHYRRAIDSWRGADADLVPRREELARAVEALNRR